MKLPGRNQDQPAKEKKINSFGWTRQSVAELKRDCLGITPTVPAMQPWIMLDAKVKLLVLGTEVIQRELQ